MKTDFILAVRQLALERNLSPETVIRDLEEALAAAFRRESSLAPYRDLKVSVDPISGGFHIFVPKMVVGKVVDEAREISIEEARRIKPDVNEGELVEVEVKGEGGRIAAQIAKQTLLQRLRKTKEITVFEEFQRYEGEVISGTVEKREGGQIWVDLGRATALLPEEEQIPGERYQPGQRLRFYVLKVCPSANKGFQIFLSRKHKNLLLRLLQLEVPEVYQGKVEIKVVAREAGSRSKVAVAAKEEGVDPVGSCIGPRGIRIQNIIKELNGEKVDIIRWEEDQAKFIANSLSPAQVQEVKLLPEEKTAQVVIQDSQFSLAIGKEGQNARLAAKLTGWRIDIKPSSLFEEEKVKEAETKIAEEAKPAVEPVLTEAKPEVPEVKEEKAKPAEVGAEIEPVLAGFKQPAPVKAEPAEAKEDKRPKTIDELLATIQQLDQKQPELKFEGYPPPKEEKKKPKKRPKIKRTDEEEEDYY